MKKPAIFATGKAKYHKTPLIIGTKFEDLRINEPDHEETF